MLCITIAYYYSDSRFWSSTLCFAIHFDRTQNWLFYWGVSNVDPDSTPLYNNLLCANWGLCAEVREVAFSASSLEQWLLLASIHCVVFSPLSLMGVYFTPLFICPQMAIFLVCLSLQTASSWSPTHRWRTVASFTAMKVSARCSASRGLRSCSSPAPASSWWDRAPWRGPWHRWPRHCWALRKVK